MKASNTGTIFTFALTCFDYLFSSLKTISGSANRTTRIRSSDANLDVGTTLFYGSIGTIGLIEIGFYFYYRWYMISYANKRIPSEEYRDYGKDRHKYFIKILERIDRHSRITNTDAMVNCCIFLLGFYKYSPTTRTSSARKVDEINDNKHDDELPPFTAKPPLVLNPIPAVVESSDESIDSKTETERTGNRSKNKNATQQQNSTMSIQQLRSQRDALVRQGVETLKRDEINMLMCWVLFGKYPHECTADWEQREMAKSHDLLEKRFGGLSFKEGSGYTYKPKVLLSLDPCAAIHRPLSAYAALYASKQIGYCLFQLCGFRFYKTKSGLRCWYRLGEKKNVLPILFMQGIAPVGPALYLLLLMQVFVHDGRSVFLFENEIVHCTMSFKKVLLEDETLDGIKEIVETFLKPINLHQSLSIAGHSHGSTILTWMIHSPYFRHRIRQMILLEPVSYLLTEPFLINNILSPPVIYGIDIVTEYFVRRRFPWYNSELWLQEIPENTQVIFGLAKYDPIVDCTKLETAIEEYCIDDSNKFNTTGSLSSTSPFASRCTVLVSNHGSHGDCLINPYTWSNLRKAMRQYKNINIV